MRVRHAVVVLLLPLVLAGCRSGGDREYEALEPARHALDGLTGRRCQYASEPRVPETLDPLTRPGTRGAMLLWGRDAAPGDSVDLSVRYGDDGRLTWVRVIRSTVAADRAVALARMIETGLLAEGPADWGVRLRVVEGRVAAVLPGVICAAEQRSRTGSVMAPIPTGREMAEVQQARGRRIEVAVSLDEQGRVMDVQLVRGSGSPALDQYAVDVARSHRYDPKLHDGLGVPTTVRVIRQVRRR